MFLQQETIWKTPCHLIPKVNWYSDVKEQRDLLAAVCMAGATGDSLLLQRNLFVSPQT